MEHDRYNLLYQSGQSGPLASVLPSRLKTHQELCRAWLNDQLGMKTLTGETGIGKSYLWRNAAELVKSRCDNIRWIALSILPRNTSQGLLHAILIALEEGPVSIQMSAEQTLARVEQRFLELLADGFRPEIVVEESHHLSREGFETLRILKDRLANHGFKVGILLVGQSPLRQKFGRLSRFWRPAGWHLQHIGASEALMLLEWIRDEISWTKAEADWIHREALGNPGRIVRWTETIEPDQIKPYVHDTPILKPGGNGQVPKQAQGYAAPPVFSEALLPVKPPLEESDGLIEVGYDDSEPEAASRFDDDSGVIETGYDSEERTTITGAEPGSRYWIDAGESHSTYRPNSTRKEVSHEFETES